jgi:hypothetical protein
MKGPTSKKTKEPFKKVNHKGNIKFQNPRLLQEAYQIKKGKDLMKGHLGYKNLHLLQHHVSKWRPPMHVDTL